MRETYDSIFKAPCENPGKTNPAASSLFFAVFSTANANKKQLNKLINTNMRMN